MREPHISASDVQGEAWTGYENSGGKGPFECANCTHSDEDSTCGQPVMVRHSKQPLVNGRRKIDPHGCCEYVQRKGHSHLPNRG